MLETRGRAVSGAGPQGRACLPAVFAGLADLPLLALPLCVRQDRSHRSCREDGYRRHIPYARRLGCVGMGGVWCVWLCVGEGWQHGGWALLLRRAARGCRSSLCCRCRRCRRCRCCCWERCWDRTRAPTQPALPILCPSPPLPRAEVFYDLKKFLEESKAAVPSQLAQHEASKNKPGTVGQGRPQIQFAKK